MREKEKNAVNSVHLIPCSYDYEDLLIIKASLATAEVSAGCCS